MSYQDGRAFVLANRELGQDALRQEHLDQAGKIKNVVASNAAPGFIYFLKQGSLVKIGWSQDPDRRSQQLGGGSVLATMPGYMADERALHDRFDLLRVEGEWFAYTPALARYISALAAEAA
jgi:hypothetical protein